LMSGFYFYPYCLMQIPAGLLYDRFHVRAVVLFPLLICAAGSYLFGIADTLTDGAIARMFMGAGAAFAFIGVLVVAGDVFPERYFALIAGITQLLAAMGAMGGELPLIPVIDSLGWRETMIVIAYTGFILGAFVWIFVRYQKPQDEVANQSELPRATYSLATIAKNPQMWVLAVYACLLWAPMAAFASLWGVPYLMAAQEMSRHSAATIVSAMWIGIAVASPLLGWWSDKIGLRKMPLILSASIGFIALSLVILFPQAPKPLLFVLIFFAGAACSGQVLSFAVVRENNVKVNHAAAIGFNNMAVVIAGAIFQPLVGKLIQLGWQGQMRDGIPIYSSSDYMHGIMVLPICFGIGALIVYALLRETHCQPQRI